MFIINAKGDNMNFLLVVAPVKNRLSGAHIRKSPLSDAIVLRLHPYCRILKGCEEIEDDGHGAIGRC